MARRRQLSEGGEGGEGGESMGGEGVEGGSRTMNDITKKK
jgi:hypothetical protein